MVRGPAVLAIAETAPRQPYVSYHRIRSIDVSRIGSPGPILPTSPTTAELWQPMRPRVKAMATAKHVDLSAADRLNDAFGISERAQTASSDGSAIQGDAATCARHLLRYLSHFGFIERSAAPVGDQNHAS